jgi:hypothetical protein
MKMIIQDNIKQIFIVKKIYLKIIRNLLNLMGIKILKTNNFTMNIDLVIIIKLNKDNRSLWLDWQRINNLILVILIKWKIVKGIQIILIPIIMEINKMR